VRKIPDTTDPDEYSRFCSFVEELAANRLLEEIPVDPVYNRGMIYGGRWFHCNGCNKIWRLIPPDFPFKGLWEPVGE